MWFPRISERRFSSGLKPGVDQEKFREGLKQGTLENLFLVVPVHEGDTAFRPAGTPHRLGWNGDLRSQEYST